MCHTMCKTLHAYLNIRRVAELREGLVEEGRRRKLLYEEKRWAAQSELRRVRAEDTAVWEKTGMLRLLLQVSRGGSVAPRTV